MPGKGTIIFNYVVKALILIIGLLFAFGIFKLPISDPHSIKIMGIVIALWGIFSLIMFRNKIKKMGREEE